MFRLPVCPRCGTVYRYGDTVREIKKKDNVCYHCNKRFRVKMFPYVLIHSAVLIAVCIAVNIVLLNGMKVLDLFSLFGVTVFFVCMILLLIPFFTKFKAVDDKDNMKLESDNRKRR